MPYTSSDMHLYSQSTFLYACTYSKKVKMSYPKLPCMMKVDLPMLVVFFFSIKHYFLVRAVPLRAVHQITVQFLF